MKKYYVVSDIHSFYKELRFALKEAGFDRKNKDHILIICGDIFDRGPDTIKVFNYIKSVPKNRRILIKGNHESLYNELLNKPYPEQHDYSNKTVDTFCHIAGVEVDYYRDVEWKQIVEKVKSSPITKFINSKEWLNYYELGNYVFVHSFIPTEVLEFDFWGDPKKSAYNPNWRNASNYEWESARWGSPWKQYLDGLFDKEKENGKILVCGHWHTSDFHKYLGSDFAGANRHDIYYGDNIIAIDGGVWRKNGEYYHPQNVLVIEKGEVK